MTEDPALRDELLRLETALARRDPTAIDGGLDGLLRLIPDDFFEHGASGRRWDAAAVREALAREPSRQVEIKGFDVSRLGEGAFLATYRSREPRDAYRASIWVRRDGRWVLQFHQGTLVPRAE